MEAKFSLEYAVAAALLDRFPDFDSFSDPQVRRPEVGAIMDAMSIDLEPGGLGLLDGGCTVSVLLSDGSRLEAELEQPPGSPSRPPDDEDLDRKMQSCGPDIAGHLRTLDWSDAPDLLDDAIGHLS